MIGGLFDQGAMPTLERLVQFASARHRVLADDIANASTPGFKPADLSVSGFQATLRDAIDRRRAGSTGAVAVPGGGALALRDTDQLRFREGRIEAHPEASNDGILFHDQNNRDLERMMQHLAENTLAHHAGVELLRSEIALLQSAIRERI